jgi:hypothetical protein
LNFYIETN